MSNFLRKTILFPNNNYILLDYIKYLKYIANSIDIVNNFVIVKNYFVQNKNKDIIFNNNIKMILLEYNS